MRTFTPRPQQASELHRSWLELVETEGPFLAIPPLKRVWPQGMFALDRDRRDILNDGRATFEKAWEARDIRPGDEDTLEAYRTARDEWVRLVLGEVAQWGEDLRWGSDAVPNATAFSPTRAISTSPSAVLMGQESASALVYVVDAGRDFAAGVATIQPLNPQWDRHLLDVLASGDLAQIDSWSNEWFVEQAGHSSHEVRTWIAAYAALSAAGQYRVTSTFYREIPEWIAGFGITTAVSTDGD